MSATEVETREGARGAGHRAHHDRHSTRPYVGQWWIWFVAIPFLGTFGWYLGWDAPTWVIWRGHVEVTLAPGDESAARFMVLMVAIGAAALAGISVLMGLGHTRRRPTGPTERTGIALVVLHVAASWLFGGLLVDLIIIFGWSLVMLITVMAGGAVGAFGWNMYRADPFRADPRGEEDKGDDGGLREATGIAKSRVSGEVERGQFATKIPFKLEGGETTETLVKALPRVEALTDSLEKRGRIEGSGRAGHADMVIMHTDPFTEWLEWPGLSAPGDTFQRAIRTAYADTGAEQRYFLAADPAANRPRSAILRVGTTGAGKSEDFNLELAEAQSRYDVHTVRIDTAKLAQNTMWGMPFLTLGADSIERARVLEQGMQDLAEYRIKVMGKRGHTNWTPVTYTELGLAAWLLQYDEADTVLAEIAEWLATKSLSAGIYMSVTIPSADNKSMPTIIRRSLGNRKCFGTGDDYSAGMVLSETTRKRGPDPFNWGAQFPGAHLLDRAPGVDPRTFVISQRSYRYKHTDIGAEVAQARTTFDPPEVTSGEIEALGEAWELCQIDKLDLDPQAPAQEQPRERVTVTQPASRPADEKGEREVKTQEVFKTPEYEPKIQEDDRIEYAKVDPRQPIPRGTAPEIVLDDDVPVPLDDGTAITDFNRAVIELYNEGKREVTNREIMDRCRSWDSVRMSRYLSALNAGKAIQPPGHALRRLRAGHHAIIKL